MPCGIIPASATDPQDERHAAPRTRELPPTFVLNYGLAVAAVALATAGLALLAVHHGAHWLPWALLGLAAAKLWLLIIMSRNTHRARHEHWNDRAVDYRYLAAYLPPKGRNSASPRA